MVDGVVCGTTIVSMMVNGMCCLYEHHEVEENRAKIKRDLRTEYWQQKLVDQKLNAQRQRRVRQQEEEVREHCEVVPSDRFYMDDVQREDRRRKLQLDKIKASGSLQSLVDAPDDPPPPVAAVTIQARSRRSRSTCSNQRRRQHTLAEASPFLKTSSLIDSDSDSEFDCSEILLIGSSGDDNGEGTFVEIAL